MCTPPPIVKNWTWGDQKTSLVYYGWHFFLTQYTTPKEYNILLYLSENSSTMLQLKQSLTNLQQALEFIKSLIVNTCNICNFFILPFTKSPQNMQNRCVKPVVLLWHSGTEKLFSACQYIRKDEEMTNHWRMQEKCYITLKPLPSHADIRNFWRI